IENLNNVYGTIFWGQTYNDFDEIPLPKPTITTHNPSLQLDWARFRSQSINRYAKLQVDIINRHKRADQKVTHNLFGGFFDRAYDQNTLSSQLDVVSYDNYPVWGGLTAPLEPAHIAMTLDYIRGLKRQNFWILEELMGAQGHTIIGYLPRPNQAKLWSHQAMARGCEALLYFRYRGMTRGAEQFCQGILDADNKINEKYLEVQSFFSEVKENESIYYKPIKAEVAILYDFDNRWSWHAQQQSHAFDFTQEFVRLYEGFYDKNVMMDVISTDQDISDYKIVVLPVMQIVDSELLNKLKQFASKGGSVVFGFRSGIKDRNNNLRLAPNILSEVCGIEVAGYESLSHGQSAEIESSKGVMGKMHVWRDLLKPIKAEMLYKYRDAFYGDYAAITVNAFEKGQFYYVGGGVCKETVIELTNRLLSEQGIGEIESPIGVEVVLRDGKMLVLNHTSQIQIFKGKKIEPYGMALID
ncbi:MAG TPA: beta-galactosidase, partial [Clostridiales bacterium UBA8960]|nr:beta-galactosidase [Clostridiales bacterium UBA8960]